MPVAQARRPEPEGPPRLFANGCSPLAAGRRSGWARGAANAELTAAETRRSVAALAGRPPRAWAARPSTGSAAAGATGSLQVARTLADLAGAEMSRGGACRARLSRCVRGAGAAECRAACDPCSALGGLLLASRGTSSGSMVAPGVPRGRPPGARATRAAGRRSAEWRRRADPGRAPSPRRRASSSAPSANGGWALRHDMDDCRPGGPAGPRGWPPRAHRPRRRPAFWPAPRPTGPCRSGRRGVPTSYGLESARAGRRPRAHRDRASSAGSRSASTPRRTRRARGRWSHGCDSRRRPGRSYPRSAALYGRSAERGLVLSELPPGSEPFRWMFPARNRVMAALGGDHRRRRGRRAVGLADHRGLAIDLGRQVGAVPGPVTLARVSGRQHAPRRRRGRRRAGPGRSRASRRAPRGVSPILVGPVLEDARTAGPRRGRAGRSTGDAVAARAGAFGAAGARRPGAARAATDTSAGGAAGGFMRTGRDCRSGRDRGCRPAAGRATLRSRVAARERSPRAVDRRLGLRRRRGHPGRPEGVRARRRPRHDRDHRDHRARTPSGSTRSARCRRRSSSPRSVVATTSASTPSRSGCSATRRRSPRSPRRSPLSATSRSSSIR